MPLMNIFEPLFILLVLTALGALVTAAVLAARGRRDRSGRILRRLGIGVGVYVAILVLSALGTQPRVYHVGEAQCFDDWCLTVVDARPVRHADSVAWTVTLRLSSRARRITQRENDAAVYLTDARHRRFDPVHDDAAVPLDAPLGPGESVGAIRRFELPADASDVGLAFTHNGGFPIGAFIITENAWFHGPAIVRFDER
jgi:hypothetical protein